LLKPLQTMVVSNLVDGVWIDLVDHVEPLGTTCAQPRNFFVSLLIRASQGVLKSVDANSFGVSAGVAVPGVLCFAFGPGRLTDG
jgi:hypothetical protein